MLNGWGSASEEEGPLSRSSLGSSSEGSIFTHCSFAQALVVAADRAGFRLEGTSLSKRGKALSHRPRPSSPFSTDGSTGGSHSLGPPRNPRTPRKGRTPGTTPHRRDPAADDLPPPPEPPPCQGQGRIQGPRSVVAPSDRKATSLERPPMSGPLEHHRQVQERLGSMDRCEDPRRAHKTEEPCVPYSKPSFPSPGGHSSSGTSSSKGSTGPRKSEGPRQPQQWTALEHADFLGASAQGHFSGELCEYR
ncbi:unnamed protein product [Knipowitschia caucasica]